MSEEEGYKEVDFHKYCPLCIHHDKTEEETPCDECMAAPANLYSHKPVMFKEK